MARWYHIGSALFILQSMQAFSVVDRLAYGEWSGKPGDNFTKGLNLLLIVSSIALFLRGYRQVRNVQTGAMLAMGLVVLLFSSVIWSVTPQATIREATLYFFVVLSAIGIATNLSADEFMGLVAKMAFWAAAMSLILLVVYRKAALGAIGDDFPDFRGIFSQKNVLGQAMAMGSLGCLHEIRTSDRRRLRRILSLVVIAVTAVLSKSATSCMAIVTFCGIDTVLFLMRKGGASRIIAYFMIVLALPVLSITMVAPDTFLEMIGKDPTLTGRTEIWGFVIPDIFQKPFLGWGYLAFWSLDNPASLEIADTVHWVVPQAHNGVLEILLSVGLVGGGFILYLFIRTFRLSIQCMRSADKAIGTSCLLLCVGIILIGTSETVLIDPFEASTGVFLISGFLCEKACRAVRRRPWRHAMPYLSVAPGGTATAVR